MLIQHCYILLVTGVLHSLLYICRRVDPTHSNGESVGVFITANSSVGIKLVEIINKRNILQVLIQHCYISTGESVGVLIQHCCQRVYPYTATYW